MSAAAIYGQLNEPEDDHDKATTVTLVENYRIEQNFGGEKTLANLANRHNFVLYGTS